MPQVRYTMLPSTVITTVHIVWDSCGTREGRGCLLDLVDILRVQRDGCCLLEKVACTCGRSFQLRRGNRVCNEDRQVKRILSESFFVLSSRSFGKSTIGTFIHRRILVSHPFSSDAASDAGFLIGNTRVQVLLQKLTKEISCGRGLHLFNAPLVELPNRV